MLAALNCQQPVHTPCSFMLFKGLQTGCKDYLDFIERQVAMGLDAYVMLPPRPPEVVNDHYNLHGLPVSYAPEVEIREWREPAENNSPPTMIKEYHTPAGILRAEVAQTSDWRWGNHIPFLDDYISSRSHKFLVTKPEELEALAYLLVPPTDAEIAHLQRDAGPVCELAEQLQLLVSGGWGVGADMLGWIFGLEEMIMASYDRPEFLFQLLELIANWNQRRMTVLLDMGIDLYIKRAWYETCHFWTPQSFRKFIFPILKTEADLAHQAGAKFGYIATSSTMPLLDQYAEAGVDVLMGVDPLEWDLVRAKAKLKGKVCLWGGVNGHLTVEQGNQDDVRREVRTAMDTLAPGGGFILSPVDNVREYTPRAKKNVHTMIQAWHSCR